VTTLEYSDSVLVAATPDQLYALVSDVTRVGEWSPQCTGCQWDDAAAGPVVGAWFTGYNESAGRTWESRNQVVVAEPGREFVWEVNDGFVRWGFAIDPEEGGSRLTESWAFLPKGVAGFHEKYGERADAAISARSADALAGIPVTLAAIKATAEAA
jgi:hypothetical protein